MINGFRYILKLPGFPALMGLTAIIVFFVVPAFTLMPILVTNHLEGDVLKLGWLNSAFGVGMIAGGILLGIWGGFKRRIVTALIGCLVLSAATVFLGFTSVALFFPALGATFLVGAGISAANAPMMAIMQSVVAQDMQGRIFSLFGSLTSALTPLGLAIAGPAADAIGIRTLYFVAGAASAITVVIFCFNRSLLNIDKAGTPGTSTGSSAAG
jgi:DHA3 family macrolide efflux protein-like MFS transporter